LPRISTGPVRELPDVPILLDSRGVIPLLASFSHPYLLSFANLPGRFDVLPLPIDVVEVRALLDVANRPLLTLSADVPRASLRTGKFQLGLPLPIAGEGPTNLPDRFDVLPLPFGLVEVGVLGRPAIGPFTDLTVTC